MSDLAANSGPTYDINIEIFNKLQHTITAWTGGKDGYEIPFHICMGL